MTIQKKLIQQTNTEKENMINNQKIIITYKLSEYQRVSIIPVGK